jgi:RNA polymerase sigma-32 factor
MQFFHDGATDMGIEGQFAGLTARTQTQPAFAKDGRGKGYLYEIRRFAMLERDREYALAKRWREHGDRDAANKLVTSHLRLAAKIAMGYRGYGLPISEIISEGNVGLMQALNRFEPEKGFRFSTYAMWWIRASALPRTREGSFSNCARRRARSRHSKAAIYTPIRSL